MQQRELTLTLDDRETNVILTGAIGSEKVVWEILPAFREGTTPCVKLSFLLTLEMLEGIRQYLAIAVRGAMIKDDIPERKQVEVPFFFGPGQMMLCLSPNDVENLERHMREIAAYTGSIALAGSLA